MGREWLEKGLRGELSSAAMARKLWRSRMRAGRAGVVWATAASTQGR